MVLYNAMSAPPPLYKHDQCSDTSNLVRVDGPWNTDCLTTRGPPKLATVSIRLPFEALVAASLLSHTHGLGSY